MFYAVNCNIKSWETLWRDKLHILPVLFYHNWSLNYHKIWNKKVKRKEEKEKTNLNVFNILLNYEHIHIYMYLLIHLIKKVCIIYSF